MTDVYTYNAYGDTDPEEASDFKSDWDETHLRYSEAAAQDYYDNCDGWESSWPKTISVFKNDRLLGVYSVELEHEPTFSATLV